jgi:hypothetical protein
MATVLLPETDPRGPKAVAIAADAGQWIKCTFRDGRKAYGIKSSSSDQYYFVTRTSCTCYDARRRECKHMLAVRLHCDLVAEQRQAAAAAKYDAIFADDDPKPMTRAAHPQLARILGKPRTERPVLEMVRHEDGEISWTPRNERKNGLVKESYL